MHCFNGRAVAKDRKTIRNNKIKRVVKFFAPTVVKESGKKEEDGCFTVSLLLLLLLLLTSYFL